jgi:sugar (pentulose or hexulose) kinase
VERFTRRLLEPIRFTGGGGPGAWCLIFADVVGRTMEQVADPVNAGARGAGLLAAVALGEPPSTRYQRNSTTASAANFQGSTSATARPAPASAANVRACGKAIRHQGTCQRPGRINPGVCPGHQIGAAVDIRRSPRW